MNYPLISEYIEAIKAAEDNFEELTTLRAVLGNDGQPVLTSGNFAVVFKMKDEETGKCYALKCFTKEQQGRAEAYKQIAEELKDVDSPYLVSIRYLEKELFVDTNQTDETEFPVLLMDWVEGKTLDKYLRENLDDKYALEMLAYRFCQLAQWLIPQPFAHGDLKPDNILVREDGTLVLVDYDGMYVPAMRGQNARELGSPNFRHPSRTEESFDERIDDFSIALIALSLKAFSLNTELISEYCSNDFMLFRVEDFSHINSCQAMSSILNIVHDDELTSLLGTFMIAYAKNSLNLVSPNIFNLKKPKEGQAYADYIYIGFSYHLGIGVEQDIKKAIEWYDKAINAGDTSAMVTKGAIFYYGLSGIPIDYEVAVKLYTKAAEKGDDDGMWRLARCYQKGKGVEENPQKAFEWFKQSADKNNSNGLCNLGVCYHYGYGVEKNYKRAVELYEKAAIDNQKGSLWRLGHCYEYGQGVEKDLEKAFEWYKKSAEQGTAEGQWRLGQCYRYARGVQRNIREALCWYKKAAEQGHEKAADVYGRLKDSYFDIYFDGCKHLENKEYKDAYDVFYSISSDAWGQNGLGICYAKGYYVEQNIDRAAYWFQKAARHGLVKAQFNMGNCFYNGWGVIKDLSLASYWYQKASDNGYWGIERYTANELFSWPSWDYYSKKLEL